jgi:hypothetical protein
MYSEISFFEFTKHIKLIINTEKITTILGILKEPIVRDLN